MDRPIPADDRPRRGGGLPAVRPAIALSALGLVAGLTMSGAVWPARAEERAATDFDIPAQPLEAALRAYSLRTRVEVLYSASLVDGKRSRAIQGSFSAPEALDLMLSGTGLRARYAGDRAITLVPHRVDPVPGTPPVLAPVLAIDKIQVPAPGADRRALERYGESLLGDIVGAIRRDAIAGKGDYRVVLKVWVDANGVITRSEAAANTAEGARSRSIESAVQGLGKGRIPPPGMPQPVIYSFEVRSGG